MRCSKIQTETKGFFEPVSEVTQARYKRKITLGCNFQFRTEINCVWDHNLSPEETKISH